MSVPILSRTVLWALLLLAGPVALAQHGERDRRGRGRRNRTTPPTTIEDLHRLRAELLDEDPVSIDKFGEYITAVSDEADRRDLPSIFRDPESIYGAGHLALREEMYGELMADPEVHEFMMQAVLDQDRDNFGVSFTVPILFGDVPSAEHLGVLFESYRSGSRSFFTSTLVRQLGRLLKALREDPDPDVGDFVREVMHELEMDAGGEDGRLAGQALEIFQRAGETDRARAHLENYLASPGDPVQRLETLSACADLLKADDFDPETRAQTLDLARRIARGSLQSAEPSAGLASLSPEARALQASVKFLGKFAATDGLDLLLEVCEDPRAAALLGMDGVQNLRFSLQRARRDLSEEQVARLDEFYIQPLRETGERLFLLEEEPMDRDEFQSFHEQRDQRYNAASYVDGLWGRNEDLRDMFIDDPDLVEYLGCLVNAREVDREDDDRDVLYYGVSEKTETRVVCARILARLETEEGVSIGDVDLFSTLLEVLVAEVGAPRRLLDIAAEGRRLGAAYLTLEVPVRKTPGDRFLMNQAVQGLRILGHRPNREGEVYRIPLEQKTESAGE